MLHNLVQCCSQSLLTPAQPRPASSHPSPDSKHSAHSAHQIVVLFLVDARQPANADAAKAHHPRVTQEEDVGGGPAAVVQLPQVVGRLVVPPNCSGGDMEVEGG